MNKKYYMHIYIFKCFLEIPVQQLSNEFEIPANCREAFSFLIHCPVNFGIEIIIKAYKIKPNLLHINLKQPYEFDSEIPLGILPSLTELVLYSLYHLFNCNWFSNDVKRFFI